MGRTNNPILSVHMVTYNHVRFINQAIDSVLSQKTNFEFELVIGEDCSTDGTREIVFDYARKYPEKIKLITSEFNVGPNANDKRTTLSCNGKYIAFCEGDDYWVDLYKIQKQIEFLETNPEFGLIHSDVNLYYEDSGRIIEQYNKHMGILIPEGEVFDYLIVPLYQMFIKTVTVCYRKEIVDKYFDFNVVLEREWKLSDLPLWLDISKHSKVHYMHESTATYRLLNESASRSKNPLVLHEFHKSVFDVYKYYCKKYSVSNDIINKINIHYNQSMLADAYCMNDKLLAQNSVDNLKKLNKRLSFKERLYYVSTKNRIISRMINLIKRLLKRK